MEKINIKGGESIDELVKIYMDHIKIHIVRDPVCRGFQLVSDRELAIENKYLDELQELSIEIAELRKELYELRGNR